MEHESQQAAVAIRSEEDRVAVVDRARAMLELARTPVEAKQVRDLAEAAKTYARLQQLGKEAVDHAHAIAIDAFARMGEMLKAAEKNAGTQGQLKGREFSGGSRAEPPEAAAPTLAEQGITKKESMLAQALATAKETAPELYDRVRANEVSVTAAHAEVKRAEREPPIAAVPDARPLPKHFRPGNNADPDHPFARSLKAFTALVKAVNRDMAEDETGFLKANLTTLSGVPIKQRMVVHGDDVWADGKRQQRTAKFTGLLLLRSVLKNSGNLKKVMTVAQIRKLCEQINEASDDQLASVEDAE